MNRLLPSVAGPAGCLLALALPVLAQAPAPAPDPPPILAPRVAEIPVNSVIHPISAEYVTAGMEQAIRQRVDLILIQLSTPGGLDTSMRLIIEKILSSPVPVVVYVGPSGSRAASAGFFILLSRLTLPPWRPAPTPARLTRCLLARARRTRSWSRRSRTTLLLTSAASPASVAATSSSPRRELPRAALSPRRRPLRTA